MKKMKWFIGGLQLLIVAPLLIINFNGYSKGLLSISLAAIFVNIFFKLKE